MEKAGLQPSSLMRKISYMKREEAGTWHPGNCVFLSEGAQLPASTVEVELDFEK